MEQDIAIMMADLSGYTAMTEVHGALSAVDTISRYLEIVNKSLVGDSFLHERVGDQVVIISSSAEHLAYTSTFLLKYSSEENHFLPVHAGLHYGKVIRDGNSYFGSTINLAARICSLAEQGKAYCSGDFINMLPSKDLFRLTGRGTYHFKNFSKPVDIYQLECCDENEPLPIHIDPVCRMIVHPQKSNFKITEGDHEIYFCSRACKEIYESSLIRQP